MDKYIKGSCSRQGITFGKGTLFMSLQRVVVDCQKIFGIGEFGAGTVLEKSFVLNSGDQKDGNQLWAAKVLLLFGMYGGRDGSYEEYSFMQYMQCTQPFPK